MLHPIDTRKVPSRVYALAMGMTMGAICLELIVSLFIHPLPPADSILQNDFATYAAALFQLEQPELYGRDTLLSDGVQTRSLLQSSGLYMRLLQGFFHIGGERIEIAWLMMVALSRGVFTFGVFALLALFVPDGPLAWLTAFAASFMLFTHGLPEGLYAGLAALILRGCATEWFLPALQDERVILWKIVLISLLVSLSSFMVNAVSGLAMLCFILTIAGLQWLTRRLSFISLLAFGAGMVPFIALRLLGSIGTGTILSDESAQLILRLARGGMVLDISGSYLAFFAVYLAAMGLTAVLSWKTQTRFWKVFFVLVQAAFWLWMLAITRPGMMLVLPLAAYLIMRMMQREDDRLDRALIVIISAAFLIGWFQQVVWHIVWQQTGWNALVSLIFQMGRFSRMAYLPIVALIGHFFFWLLMPVTDRRVRWGMRLLLAVLCYETVTQPNFALTLPPLLLTGGVLLRGLRRANLMLDKPRLISVEDTARRVPAMAHIVFRFSVMAYGTMRRPGVTAGMLCGAAGLFWLSSVFVMDENAARIPQVRSATNSADYLVMTAWLRENTPPDSLLFITDYDRSLRFFSRRSSLVAHLDTVTSLYCTCDPLVVRQLFEEAEASRITGVTGFAARHGVDYVILTAREAAPYPALYNGVWYVPQEVYRNAHYRVYAMRVKR